MWRWGRFGRRRGSDGEEFEPRRREGHEGRQEKPSSGKRVARRTGLRAAACGWARMARASAGSDPPFPPDQPKDDDGHGDDDDVTHPARPGFFGDEVRHDPQSVTQASVTGLLASRWRPRPPSTPPVRTRGSGRACRADRSRTGRIARAAATAAPGVFASAARTRRRGSGSTGEGATNRGWRPPVIASRLPLRTAHPESPTTEGEGPVDPAGRSPCRTGPCTRFAPPSPARSAFGSKYGRC
jgi:hypothetical protein